MHDQLRKFLRMRNCYIPNVTIETSSRCRRVHCNQDRGRSTRWSTSCDQLRFSARRKAFRVRWVQRSSFGRMARHLSHPPGFYLSPWVLLGGRFAFFQAPARRRPHVHPSLANVYRVDVRTYRAVVRLCVRGQVKMWSYSQGFGSLSCIERPNFEEGMPSLAEGISHSWSFAGTPASPRTSSGEAVNPAVFLVSTFFVTCCIGVFSHRHFMRLFKEHFPKGKLFSTRTHSRAACRIFLPWRTRAELVRRELAKKASFKVSRRRTVVVIPTLGFCFSEK